ncbi:MAG: type II toxin-antitoxin system VapC family toxin [Chloroflexi bacterium]|nr:type II toxin-antitoxin system VapC family toxin [Chloroflexota bacterium]
MTDAPQVVLDASALLAALQGEPGGVAVEARLDQAGLSTVNLAEVMQRSVARGVAVEGLTKDLEALGVTILPFTAEDAQLSASLWPKTRHLGLSLGDRACLALALRLGSPALTTDQVWSQLEVDVNIQVLR